MRRKKHKNVRRAVRFYKVSYGFREPFKVLLDGNFIHVMREMTAGDPKERIPQLLGGQCRCFVTKCVMHELRGLGPDFKLTHDDARRVELFQCGHDDAPLAPSACLSALVGAANAEHLWVCSQDAELRQRLNNIPGAPSLFMTVNGMMLEEPSDYQEALVRNAELRHMGVQEHERRGEALRDLRPEVIRTSAKFRKNKAKGPNPMSVKKSVKTKGAGKGKGKAGGEGAAGDAEGKKKRQRRRKHGGGGDGATSVDG